MLVKMRKNPERVSPAQAKAIADAAAEVSGLDWRYVVSGEILARSLRSETDIAKDARYRESLRAARSAAQVVIDATAEPRTMASVPLAQAFAALAMLAHMAGMEGEEKTMRAFVDVATADAATSYQRAWLDEEQMKRKELEKAARVDVL
jgi:hypothetical protein